jgi:hypothetical protein
MDANAVQHGPAANGVGPRTPFAHPVEIKPAFRHGIHIGDGLFAMREFRKGETVVSFVEGGYLRMHEWGLYCLAHDLPSDWAGFLGSKCIPPPTKRVATVVLYDTSWTSADTRPEWTFMNHSTTAPNVRPVLPSGRSCVIRFVALRRVLEGEELVFDYGGYSADCGELPRFDRSWVVSGRTRRPSRSGCYGSWVIPLKPLKPLKALNHVKPWI